MQMNSAGVWRHPRFVAAVHQYELRSGDVTASVFAIVTAVTAMAGSARDNFNEE
jgi:hypothetical protein